MEPWECTFAPTTFQRIVSASIDNSDLNQLFRWGYKVLIFLILLLHIWLNQIKFCRLKMDEYQQFHRVQIKICIT